MTENNNNTNPLPDGINLKFSAINGSIVNSIQQPPLLRIKKFYKDSLIPIRGSKRSAGYDLFAYKTEIIEPYSRVLVSTGIGIGIPPGHYGRVAPRSGLAWRKSIDIGAGVIDEDYRGEVLILMVNNSGEHFYAKKGERIAQLILEKVSTPDTLVVENLDETDRGSSGYGSTGMGIVIEKKKEEEEEEKK